MPATTRDLRDWIVRRYHDYTVSDEPVLGTYGLVWFLSASWSRHGFAVKSLAPERLVESKSAKDVDYLRREFRMWLELPPAYNVLPALGFDEAWVGKRWVENGARALEGISSDRVRGLVERCLRADPNGRPTPYQCLHELCEELRETYGIEVEPKLAVRRAPVFDAPPIADDEHVAWAAAQWIGPGGTEARRSLEQLDLRLMAVEVQDFESCERWTVLAEPIIPLRQGEGSDVAPKVALLRQAATSYLKSILGPMDGPLLANLAVRADDPVGRQRFERLSDAIRRITDIAGLTYERARDGALGLGPVALSALAYSYASSARMESLGATTVDQYLAEAIRNAPEQPVPYYFRAFWRWLSFCSGDTAEQKPSENVVADWVSDLETACRLAPEWSEPKQLLEELQAELARGR